MKKPLTLIIMDGYGLNPDAYGNAIYATSTPNLDKYFANCPNIAISASGMDVGLPDGQMGNSEVGHANIGAGRVVYQDLTRISKSISDGDFFTNKTLTAAIDNCVKNNSALHLMGLVSDGGVHSHTEHLYALLRLAKEKGMADDRVFIHCFTDGRDVPPKSGKGFIGNLSKKIKEIGVGKISSVSGRYYAMDRDTRWERVEKAYLALTAAVGDRFENAESGMNKSYANDVTDEFIAPFVCGDNCIRDTDSVIFFNFRPDRAREITRAFTDPQFDGFNREKLLDLYFVCMTQYDATMPNVHTAYIPQSLDNTLGQYLSACGKTQLRIAETTKYAHVTFFFNGGIETVYPGEDRILIPTPNVATFDLKPEMSAFEVAEAVVEKMSKCDLDVIILNFANCDMVGHTGIFDAAKAAVAAVDKCVGKVVEKTLELGGIAIISADHGNADKMYEPDGSPFTAHTTNTVPFIIVGMGNDCNDVHLLKQGGKLADIAPTMLAIMGLDKPAEMDGVSLIL